MTLGSGIALAGMWVSIAAFAYSDPLAPALALVLGICAAIATVIIGRGG